MPLEFMIYKEVLLMYSNKAKRRILSLSLLILMLSVLSYGTYAFFTAEDTATNVITAGRIDITLIEQREDENGGFSTFENVVGVMPGQSVSKIVSVQNTGSSTAWVRISVDKTLTMQDGITAGDGELLSIDYNSSEWEYKDGFWYYLAPLRAGEFTAPLFTAVSFAGEEMGNEFQNSVAVIGVLAQATQHANNGDNVYDAAGWSVVEEY